MDLRIEKDGNSFFILSADGRRVDNEPYRDWESADKIRRKLESFGRAFSGQSVQSSQFDDRPAGWGPYS